jgi:competence protein ComEA
VPSISVSRSTALVAVCALLAALVVAGHRLASTGAATAPEAVAPLEAVTLEPGTFESGTLEPAASARKVVVHVAGAVRRPGLYRLEEGKRVADAVERAGGPTARAFLGSVNLAAPLVDGTQVLVPLRMPAAGLQTSVGEALPGMPGSSGGPAASGQKLSLSTATAEQLDELPGVGPVTAQKILDYRAEHGVIRSVDELDAVPGIGPARMEQLRDLVTP